jgi:hypothetical protein
VASKKSSDSKKPARKKNAKLRDLSAPGQELSESQAKRVKGGSANTNFAKLKLGYED